MASFYEVIFILQLLAVLVITGFKVVNLTTLGAVYDKRFGFLLFAGFVVAWFLGLVVVLFQPTQLVYSVIFRFENLFMLLQVLFLIGEVLLDVYMRSVETYRDNFKSRR